MALDPPYALNNEEGISFPCGICLLCKDGMVKKTSLIKLKNRKTIELKKKIQKFWDICGKMQCMRRFNIIQSSFISARQSHPFRKDVSFIDTTVKVQSQIMLMIEQHLDYITKKTQNIEKIFKRSFFNYLQDTTENYSDLAFLESKWINKLEATININKIILPLSS